LREMDGADAQKAKLPIRGRPKRRTTSCRFIYNRASALNRHRYEAKGKQLGYAVLSALLP
jgi:hypothetical protein